MTWKDIESKVMVKQMKEQVVGQAEAQIEAQKAMLMAQADPIIQQLQALVGMAQGGGAGAESTPQEQSTPPNGSSGGNGHVGRPPSGNVPPHLETKKDEAGAPRPVVSESK
jgi:hypothetical protein